MRHCSLFLLLCLTWSFFFLGTYQISSQTEVLLQLRKLLEYPKQLEYWNDQGLDFCYLSSSTQVNITCQDNSVTELKIVGDKPNKANNYDGFAIPNQTLSDIFSMDSFVATLARLTSLRVLSLVSLGIWGPLPDKIHRLSSLEFLDLSSNFLSGPIPPKLSTMVRLHTVILDHNFFNDTVPSWFDSLSNLTVLSLKNNQLKGPFPSSLGKITTLTDLVLSSNKISGEVPDISGLSSLLVVDLSLNELDSNLPKMPRGLVVAVLSNNSFSGEITKQFSQLSHLQHLDISINLLEGAPPAAVFSLPNISYLNLASNMLSGSLPHHLRCGSKLEFVDISENRLTGDLPSCLSIKSEGRLVKFSGNCLSVDAGHQHTTSHCTEANTNKKHSGGKNVVILVCIIGGALVFMVLLAFVFLCVFRRFCPRGISEQHLLHKAGPDNSVAGFSSEMLTSARFISQAAKLGIQGLPACRPFALEELKEATNNFDNSAYIGEGSHGKLYKGRLENGTQVTIRCLLPSKKFSIRNLKLRLDLLAKLRHPHLVCLLGYCIYDGGQDNYSINTVFLIYEYVYGGDFPTQFSENRSGKGFDWSERLAILIGVARAVHFLHTGVIPGFFNNQLKTNNILLNEHKIAKLSDYGLSIISEETGSRGGEIEGDVKSRQMTRFDDDVYSFGFILLEALIGRSGSARRAALTQDEWAFLNNQEERLRVVDAMVMATCSQESLSIVVGIMNKCIHSESWSRPSFEDILWNLQYAAQVQSTADEQKMDKASFQ
ncbi:inactive leucine-rich repeat receptor-like protein kinase [Tripterygium wilfordii]|uniref:Inactive leucine-rich repeat receptor-like protein kinase n=1 Tax=Tripterygium wilfordii TaxID=458696 RepID=A0A7J7CEA5_TRIWF|nr:probable inactive leucine-rich repeat receptor-like protein kinase At3g03770 isoform X2 [Tripterygium wilfordii]KAF5732207.1 inactive leucine-rich repeat receptor-like protein kinase [Tripterygium wilfordii]